MATSKVSITEGSGKNMATHSFTEDAVTKDLQRYVLSDNAGTDIAVATSTNQTTIISHLDGVEGLLTTIDADTSVLAATDFMLGSDFSNVLGTASLVLATQADDIANTSDGIQTTTFNYVFDGTTWDRVRGDSTDGLLVNLGANNDVVVSATNLDIRDLTSASDSVAAVQSGTWTVGLSAGTNNIGDVDVLSVVTGTGATNLGKAVGNAAGATDTGVVLLSIRDDALTTLSDAEGDYVPTRVDSTGALWIQGAVSVTGSVTATVSGNVSAISQGVGDDDSISPSNPVMIGGMSKSPDGTDPGNVSAELDIVRAITDLNRRIFVNDEHPRWFSYHSNGSTALTDASVAADPGDGFQIVITDIQFSNGSTTAINMFLEEGASTIWGPVYLEAVNGRGYVWKGKKHVTASTALTVTTSASVAHSVEILGYIQAV